MEDPTSRETRPGFLDSIRDLVATAVAIVHNRFELVATEFQEELSRLVAVLLWALAAILGAAIAATFVAVAVLMFLAPEHRAVGAALIAAAFLVLAVVSWVTVRRLLRAKPRPFDASLRELERDHEQLRDSR